MAIELKKSPDLRTVNLSVNTVVSDLVELIFPASTFVSLLLNFAVNKIHTQLCGRALKERKKNHFYLLKSVQFCGEKLKPEVIKLGKKITRWLNKYCLNGFSY